MPLNDGVLTHAWGGLDSPPPGRRRGRIMRIIWIVLGRRDYCVTGKLWISRIAFP